MVIDQIVEHLKVREEPDPQHLRRARFIKSRK